MGPVDSCKRLLRMMGWRTETHEHIVDEDQNRHEVVSWREMIFRGVKRARQVLWGKASAKRPNYAGVQQ